jgi:hypothetical protein
MDNSSNYRDIMPDTYYTNNLWGPSEYDTAQVLIVNYLYDLPFFKSGQRRCTSKVLGGWEISGNTQFQTGNPCGVGASNDYAGVGEVGSFGCGTNTIRGAVLGAERNADACLSTSTGQRHRLGQVVCHHQRRGTPLFTAPPAGTFNLQHGIRDKIYGPGFQNWNLFMRKAFPVFGRMDSSSAPRPTTSSIIPTGRRSPGNLTPRLHPSSAK